MPEQSGPISDLVINNARLFDGEDAGGTALHII
jgi:hypothetical protein